MRDQRLRPAPPKVQFHYRGRIFPEIALLTLDYTPHFVREGADVPACELEVQVRAGEFDVAVSVAAFDDATTNQFAHVAYDLMRSIVEVASFADGIAYAVLLDESVDPNGVAKPIVIRDRDMGDLSTVIEKFGEERVLEVILADIQLARALSDAAVVLSWLHYAPIAGGRIADSIVRNLTGGRTPSHWAEMRDALRVDRPYLDLLTSHATPARHGERLPVAATDNALICKRAWTLLDRFLHHRLGGPLDPNEFPLLKG